MGHRGSITATLGSYSQAHWRPRVLLSQLPASCCAGPTFAGWPTRSWPCDSLPFASHPPSGLVGRVHWRRTVFSSPVCVCSTASGSCWPRPPGQRHQHSLFLTAFPAFLPSSGLSQQCLIPSLREANPFHVCSFLEYPRSALISLFSPLVSSPYLQSPVNNSFLNFLCSNHWVVSVS